MITKYLDYVGLCKNEYPRKKETYLPIADKKLSKSYLVYLEDLKITQDKRQQTIESKNSQIMGQSSIVISIVSLFVPLFANQLNDLELIFKIPLLVIFVVLFFHFILAIIHAIKMLQIDKTRYMEGSTTTVTKDDRAKTEESFINEQIVDLVRMINYNNSVTNLSASNLVYASRCFRVGVITFLVFILSLLLSFTGLKKTIPNVTIPNIKELNPACNCLKKNLANPTTLSTKRQTDTLKSKAQNMKLSPKK